MSYRKTVYNFYGIEIYYNRDRFDPYGFLSDGFLENPTIPLNRIVCELKEIPPHELYQDFRSIAPRGCGQKTSTKIIQLAEKYRANNPKHFCECGEPYLHWYKFCPECGKERKT